MVELTLWYLIIALSFLLLDIYCLHSVIDIMYYIRTCNITHGMLAIVFLLTVGLMNVVVLKTLVVLLR